jgi:hypothetical protein
VLGALQASPAIGGALQVVASIEPSSGPAADLGPN